jgi:hypothetical protein
VVPGLPRGLRWSCVLAVLLIAFVGHQGSSAARSPALPPGLTLREWRHPVAGVPTSNDRIDIRPSGVPHHPPRMLAG